jgi:hypothetical protein
MAQQEEQGEVQKRSSKFFSGAYYGYYKHPIYNIYFRWHTAFADIVKSHTVCHPTQSML